jgi:hypothetical protein
MRFKSQDYINKQLDAMWYTVRALRTWLQLKRFPHVRQPSQLLGIFRLVSGSAY